MAADMAKRAAMGLMVIVLLIVISKGFFSVVGGKMDKIENVVKLRVGKIKEECANTMKKQQEEMKKVVFVKRQNEVEISDLKEKVNTLQKNLDESKRKLDELNAKGSQDRVGKLEKEKAALEKKLTDFKAHYNDYKKKVEKA